MHGRCAYADCACTDSAVLCIFENTSKYSNRILVLARNSYYAYYRYCMHAIMRARIGGGAPERRAAGLGQAATHTGTMCS
eukprot:COSAG05_NODE_646_length_8119_cov_236.689900_13_plen_80_part_00